MLFCSIIGGIHAPPVCWISWCGCIMNPMVQSVRLLPSIEGQGRITWPDQCTTGWHDSSKAVNVVAPLYSFTSCVYISTPGRNIHMVSPWTYFIPAYLSTTW